MDRTGFDRLRAAKARQGWKPAISAAAALDRLREALGFADDAALSGFLDMDPSALSRLRREDELPMAPVLAAAVAWGLSIDWILLGGVPGAAGPARAAA